jgi:hypothetical protein
LDPEHRFLWFLSKMFRELPGSEWFEELDPMLKAYMYEQWCRDEEEKHELSRLTAILTGSFTNPEAAKKMLGVRSGDTVVHESSDEDFEKAWEMVQQAPLKRQRRRAAKRN